MLQIPEQRVQRVPWSPFTVAVVVGLLVSPFAAVWTALLAPPVAVVAWAADRRRPSRNLRVVIVVVVGLLLGAVVYLALGLLLGLLDGTSSTGSA